MKIYRCIVNPLIITSPHPTAAHLDIAIIGEHNVVVGRHYDNGTLGFFIPDGATVPDNLAEDMWVKGKLAGSQKNRVKAKEMHGRKSDGLFYGSQYFEVHDGTKHYIESSRWKKEWVPGYDVTDEVGVVLKQDFDEKSLEFGDHARSIGVMLKLSRRAYNKSITCDRDDDVLRRYVVGYSETYYPEHAIQIAMAYDSGILEKRANQSATSVSPE